MKKIGLAQQKEIMGGFYWKCKHSYHSSWPANTFVSAYYFTWTNANSRRAEHQRMYDHNNTWVTGLK